MIFSRTIFTLLVAALLGHCKPVPHSSNFYARAACKPRVDSQSSPTPSLQSSPSPSPTSSPLPSSSPIPSPSPLPSPSTSSNSSASCFPAVGFAMPSSVPQDVNGWWCDMNTEYAFMGFSYAVNSCEHDSFRFQFKFNPDIVLLCRTCRSKRCTAEEGICGHPKNLQRTLCTHLRCVRQ